MKLITNVKIEGFRSIQTANIRDVSDFTALAGLNNSGKSNVLRALNAFFNDETEPDRYVDVDADFHRQDMRKRKRKRIRVTVEFNLPSQFRFRQGLQPISGLLGGNTFRISKEWTRNTPLPRYFLNDAAVSLDDEQKLNQFLSLIKFRYVPNRVLPTELIRNEHRSLRDVLVRRLARRAQQDHTAFAAIGTASAKMIEALVKRFAAACPGEGTVTMATPTSWQDMAFAFGYRLTRDGIAIEDIGQGSGIQSLLMLETLYLVDRDYFQQFGWRQAAVWAVEEPESSLHASLEARMAAYLSSIAAEPSGRLQILCTTHSDLIVQYASQTTLATQSNGKSTFEVLQDAKTSLDRLSRAGVSRWVHPLLYSPLDPIILVEGKYDSHFVEEAFRHFKPSRNVRVTNLEALDGSTGGDGVDRIQRYIKDNAPVIKSRRHDAPLIVVLDWDSRSKVDGLTRLVGSSYPYKVLAWPDSALNPNLGTSFKGVERSYPDRVIELAIAEGAAVARQKNGRYIADRDGYGDTKVRLNRIVSAGLLEADFSHARPFIQEILSTASAG